MAIEKNATGSSLADVITLEQPLGPPQSEALLDMGQDIFRELYDETNTVHALAKSENPFFIVGRKGAGKTAFLIGTAIADHADVILIRSEDVYLEVNKLVARHRDRGVPLAADNLVHVWEVLLFHAAMLQIARSHLLPNSAARQRVWAYMSSFGDPETVEVDGLLAAVGAEMTECLLSASPRLSFREACWSIRSNRGRLIEAADKAREVLVKAGPKAMYVVVDNLEDLHRKLDEFADVVTALFRVASRSVVSKPEDRLPFRTRFAFPAELLPRLRILAANPEKDFQKRLIIRWSAKELIVIAGNRLRTFLDVRFPTAPRQLGLPTNHDPADAEAAIQTLRAILPERVTNSLGGEEDPVAYLMRHTQLLPRHVIILLNEIVSNAVVGLSPKDVPRATAAHVVEGIAEAERVIVEGILTTYSDTYPEIADALDMIKNHVLLVEPASRLHHIYNQASVKRSGLSFDKFLDACLAIGVLGVVSEDHDERYIQGVFSYTFAGEVRPVEDRDRVCVHPLFVSRLFDIQSIETMKRQNHRAIYPYGSDPSHVDLEV